MVSHLFNARAADKVVRGNRDEGMRVVSMYSRIMVPLDLSESSLDKAALDKALDLAEAEESTLRLIHVVPLTPALLADYVPLDFRCAAERFDQTRTGSHRQRYWPQRPRNSGRAAGRCVSRDT